MKKQRTRVSAYALIQEGDQILLCRISSELPRWEGFWTLPGGGIEFGEDPESAVIREVKEETGLNVEPISIATIDSFAERGEKEDFHGIRVIYHVRVIDGVLENEKSGTTDLCKWQPLSISDEEVVDLVKVGINQTKIRRSEQGDAHNSGSSASSIVRS